MAQSARPAFQVAAQDRAKEATPPVQVVLEKADETPLPRQTGSATRAKALPLF